MIMKNQTKKGSIAMCLYVDRRYTEIVRNRLAKKGYLIAYKMVERYNSYGEFQLVSPSRRGFEWKPGWNKSTREFLEVGKDVDDHSYLWTTVGRGIHVYLGKSVAVARLENDEDRRIVKVKCLAKDFVAAEDHFSSEAVFMKAWLPKVEYDKALNLKAHAA
jgi:hypothetical protein